MTPVRLTLWVKFPLSSTALSSCSLHDLIRTIYFPAKRHSTSEYTLQRHYHTRWIFTVIVLRHDKLYLVWPPNNHKICLSTKMSIHINYTHMRAHAHTHTHTHFILLSMYHGFMHLHCWLSFLIENEVLIFCLEKCVPLSCWKLRNLQHSRVLLTSAFFETESEKYLKPTWTSMKRFLQKKKSKS